MQRISSSGIRRRLEDELVERMDYSNNRQVCVWATNLWSVVIPSEAEKMIAPMTGKANEFGDQKLVIGNMKMQSKVVQEKAKEQDDQLNSEIRSLFVAGTSLPVASKSLEQRRSLLAPVPESPTTAGMTIEIYTPPDTTKLHIHKKAAHQASQNHDSQMSSL
ncbi:hypothetical protein Tco_1210920 [Tanacetum coccineum]